MVGHARVRKCWTRSLPVSPAIKASDITEGSGPVAGAARASRGTSIIALPKNAEPVSSCEHATKSSSRHPFPGGATGSPRSKPGPSCAFHPTPYQPLPCSPEPCPEGMIPRKKQEGRKRGERSTSRGDVRSSDQSCYESLTYQIIAPLSWRSRLNPSVMRPKSQRFTARRCAIEQGAS